jgi:putative acetyltransferase
MSVDEQQIMHIRDVSRTFVRELGLLDCYKGITLTQAHILVELESFGVLRIKELAAKLHVDDSTMSRTIKKIVDSGWVTMKPDAADKRARLLTLTKKGKAKLDDIHERHNQLVGGALTILNESEQETVVNGLSLYAKALYRARLLADVTIEEVQKKDNLALGQVIRSVLIEHGANKPGFAFVDPELDDMYKAYHAKTSRYFVIKKAGKIVGGGGINQLKGGNKHTCELQKMYFLPETRGLGLGGQLLKKCLDFAKEAGYKKCYLETLQYMHKAREMYKGYGFQQLSEPMGNTGHSGCNFWMIKDL